MFEPFNFIGLLIHLDGAGAELVILGEKPQNPYAVRDGLFLRQSQLNRVQRSPGHRLRGVVPGGLDHSFDDIGPVFDRRLRIFQRDQQGLLRLAIPAFLDQCLRF